MREWAAPSEDVVVKTTVRLSRNFADVPFDSLMSDENACGNIDRVSMALESSGHRADFALMRMDSLSPAQRQRLIDQHMITPDLGKRTTRGAAFLSKGSTISILVNEENHVEIMGILPGLQIERAVELACQADAWIDQIGAYAYDDQFGYLTVDPAKTGSGMSLNLLLHLPVLRVTGQVSPLAKPLIRQAIKLTPCESENGMPTGDQYLLSMQVQLGKAEEDALAAFLAAAESIMERERMQRSKLINMDRLLIEDRMARCLAIAESARILTERELKERCSELRLCAALGLLDISVDAVDRLTIDLLNATIDCREGEKMSDRQRDVMRAIAFREAVSQMLDNHDDTD